MRQSIKDDGRVENRISWYLDDNGLLTVEGEGKIPDCDCGSNPAAEWESVKDMITEVSLMEGITEVGIKAFCNCRNLEKVTLPHSVRRLHAYAFQNCTKLISIITDRPDFRYIYDKSPVSEDDTVIFGIECFYGVPWAKNRWGNYYIKDGQLFTSFAGAEADLELPANIRTLKSFSLSHLKVRSMTLPSELEAIEAFTFFGSEVENTVHLPDSVKEIAVEALMDCSIKWTGASALEVINGANKGFDANLKKRLPSLFKQYRVSGIASKTIAGFKKIMIVKNRHKARCEEGQESVVIDTRVDVGSFIYRKLQSNQVVLCITWEENRLLSVKSFVLLKSTGLINEYLMYPVQEEGQEVMPWRDSCTYQEKEDLINAFSDINGSELYEKCLIRLVHPDVHEEFFVSGDKGNFAGPLELDLLELWLARHPEIEVDTTLENIEKDKYRWFVGI